MLVLFDIFGLIADLLEKNIKSEGLRNEVQETESFLNTDGIRRLCCWERDGALKGRLFLCVAHQPWFSAMTFRFPLRHLMHSHKALSRVKSRN